MLVSDGGKEGMSVYVCVWRVGEKARKEETKTNWSSKIELYECNQIADCFILGCVAWHTESHVF